jgi:sigma-54 dependent transcriptional regulator, acetoin dehydrogenase operon transcriptional activator AcoR
LATKVDRCGSPEPEKAAKNAGSLEETGVTVVALDQLGSKEYTQAVERAWERLIADYPIEDSAIRDVVLRSWRRCRALGIDPAQRTAPANKTDASRLNWSRDGWLSDSVRTSLDEISPYLEKAQSVAVVSDLTGAVVSVEGDRKLTEALACSSGIMAGAILSEHYGGTNAVGTALEVGGPVTIHAGEHFCQTGKAWSCSATVIRDPVDRSVVGAVDITNPATMLPMLARACVVALVERIQAHLMQQELLGRTRLIEHFFEQRHRSDTIVAFDRRGRIVKSTPGAKIEGFVLGQEEQIPGLDRGSIERWNFARLPHWIRPEYLSPVQLDGVCFGGLLRIPYHGSLRNGAPAIVSRTLPSALRRLADASPSLLPMLAQAERIAPNRLPVLLQGETGTGKDVLAKAIHEASSVATGPFVAVNCAALPRELIAGELFGHAEGAFTGARRGGAKGRFEEANGGTIFLDEIGDMPIDLQPYLLRVLEEGASSRLGESTKRRISVRVIAATNRPLDNDVAQGRFRSDLFYRLDGISLHLPPLRERAADIPCLVRSILRTLTPAREIPPEVGPDLLEILCAHDWPGNIRELRNVLSRILALSSDKLLDARALPWGLGSQTAARRPDADRYQLSNLRDNERRLILDAVTATGGSPTEAAKAIGISRATIYRRLKSYRGTQKDV